MTVGKSLRILHLSFPNLNRVNNGTYFKGLVKINELIEIKCLVPGMQKVFNKYQQLLVVSLCEPIKPKRIIR